MELVVIIKSITTATENKKEENKIQNQLQNKSKDTNNNKYFSWISAVSILSLIVSHSLPPSPQGAFQYWAGLCTCCRYCSDSNLALLLHVLASNVHRCQNQGIFLYGNSLPFYIFHRQNLPSLSGGFNLQLVQLWGSF